MLLISKDFLDKNAPGELSYHELNRENQRKAPPQLSFSSYYSASESKVALCELETYWPLSTLMVKSVDANGNVGNQQKLPMSNGVVYLIPETVQEAERLYSDYATGMALHITWKKIAAPKKQVNEEKAVAAPAEKQMPSEELVKAYINQVASAFFANNRDISDAPAAKQQSSNPAKRF